MEKETEIFELVDDQDNVIGTEHRGVVHRKGLLHRAVYCWVMDPQGRLLIQQRSPFKKIGPSQWDLSVAEHLQPGETYHQAVIRGLQEELGIEADPASLSGPLAPTHKRQLHQGEFHDIELVQSYLLKDYIGPVAFADGEVVAVEWVSMSDLQSKVDEDPERYTQWFKEEAASLGWLKLPAAAMA